MSALSEDEVIQKLSDEFSRIIRDSLKPEDLAEVLGRNKAAATGVCATHDFRDANVAMEEAFVLVLRREFDPLSAADLAFWDAAWELARHFEFPRKLELITNAEDLSVYAFSIKDFWIGDPRLSECGRFAVEPNEYYGLRLEEIAALDIANARLHADRGQVCARAVDVLAERVRPNAFITIANICRRFGEITAWRDEDGHFALRHACASDGYLLITKPGYRELPPEDSLAVSAGRYASNGDVAEDATIVTLDELEQWVEGAHTRARSPTTIFNYFVEKLGAAHDDTSLRTLPIESPCAQECVKAIDAGAALITHVFAALGKHMPDHIENIQEVVRDIGEVYWRG